MKASHLILLGLMVSQFSYADVEELAEDQALETKIVEVESLKVKTKEEEQKKLGVLASLRKAKKGFKEWKAENPNHREIRREFRRVAKLIKKKGTQENLALQSALDKCGGTIENCGSSVVSTLNSIYANSNLSAVAKVAPKFSIISSAHADSIHSVNDCKNSATSQRTSEDGQFFLGVFGADPNCGLTYIGGGLSYMAEIQHVQLCVGNGRGINAGVYAQAGALFGVGTGLTIGEGGVCQMFSVSALGAGAFAGVLIIDGDKFQAINY